METLRKFKSKYSGQEIEELLDKIPVIESTIDVSIVTKKELEDALPTKVSQLENDEKYVSEKVLETKEYKEFIAASNSSGNAGAKYCFLKVMPNDYNTPVVVRYRITVTPSASNTDAYKDYLNAVYDIEVRITRNAIQYVADNMFASTSYYAIRYNTYWYLATKEGFDADVPHLLGIYTYNGYLPTTATCKRDIKVELIGVVGGEAHLTDELKRFDATDCYSTTIHTTNSYISTVLGNYHSGDQNSTYTINYSYDAGIQKAGIGTNAISRYVLCMQKPDLTWEKIVDTSKAYTTATTKDVNTRGFLLNRIRYYNTTTVVANGGNIATNCLNSKAASVDMRYSTNCGTPADWTAGDYVYLVGKIGSDGLFYLDETKWWSTSLPTTEDGKLYIQIGVVITTASYSASFWDERPIFCFKNGSVRLYNESVGSLSELKTNEKKDIVGAINEIMRSFTKMVKVGGYVEFDDAKILSSVPSDNASKTYICDGIFYNEQRGKLYAQYSSRLTNDSGWGGRTIEGYLEAFPSISDTYNAMSYEDYRVNNVCVIVNNDIWRYNGTWQKIYSLNPESIVTAQQKENWNTAYEWVADYGSNADAWDDAVSKAHTHPNKATLDNITPQGVETWHAAYSWGDHSEVGYAQLYYAHSRMVSDVMSFQSATMSQGLVFDKNTMILYGYTASLSLGGSGSVSRTLYPNFSNDVNGKKMSDYQKKGVCICVDGEIFRHNGTEFEKVLANESVNSRLDNLEDLSQYGDLDYIKSLTESAEEKAQQAVVTSNSASEKVDGYESRVTEVYTAYKSGALKGDTGKQGEQGLQGNSGYSGAADELEVVNNLTQGGATAALSAEMGKYLYEKIEDGNYEIIYESEWEVMSEAQQAAYVQEHPNLVVLEGRNPLSGSDTYFLDGTLHLGSGNRISVDGTLTLDAQISADGTLTLN